LEKVLPLLDDANKALEKIRQEDITLIRSFTSPPSTLDLLMQAVCVSLGEENLVKWKNKDTNDPSKGKEQDFWEYAKRCLLNNKLIVRIQSYREDKIKAMNPK
jgi:dynein heavy chain